MTLQATVRPYDPETCEAPKNYQSQDIRLETDAGNTMDRLYLF